MSALSFTVTPPVATNEMSGASSTSTTVTVTVIVSSTVVSTWPLASFPSLTPTLMVWLGAVSRSSGAFVSNWPVAVLMPKRLAPLVME